MKYEYHPLANIFPLIEGQAYQDLMADVMKHGVREPIWLYEGKVLDGRNRLRAAEAMGVKYDVKVYEGSDAAAFVISLNLHRRHLTESQRAAVAAKLASLPLGSNQHAQICAPSQEKAAEMLNVSRRSVQAAAKVLHDGDEELVHAVERGDVAVSAAATVAELPKERQKKIVQEGRVKQEAKRIKSSKRDAIPEVKPAATPHVLQVINGMDVLIRYAQGAGLSIEGLEQAFLSEVNPEHPVIADRLHATLPVMAALGRIADELATRTEA